MFRKMKKKHNKIILIARSKLHSTDSIISKALTDNENSHEEFTTILNEVDNYRKQKT